MASPHISLGAYSGKRRDIVMKVAVELRGVLSAIFDKIDDEEYSRKFVGYMRILCKCFSAIPFFTSKENDFLRRCVCREMIDYMVTDNEAYCRDDDFTLELEHPKLSNEDLNPKMCAHQIHWLFEQLTEPNVLQQSAAHEVHSLIEGVTDKSLPPTRLLSEFSNWLVEFRQFLTTSKLLTQKYTFIRQMGDFFHEIATGRTKEREKSTLVIFI